MAIATETSTITVTPASPAVGALVSGVDIAAGVGDEQLADICQAYSDHGVIFFRDQHIEWAERCHRRLMHRITLEGEAIGDAT